MKRSEIYLKAAEIVRTQNTYGCFALNEARGKFAFNDVSIEGEFPEFHLFEPTAKEHSIYDGTGDSSGYFGGDFKHRAIALLFAYEIAKSNGN